jgi:hypothetical protein
MAPSLSVSGAGHSDLLGGEHGRPGGIAIVDTGVTSPRPLAPRLDNEFEIKQQHH